MTVLNIVCHHVDKTGTPRVRIPSTLLLLGIEVSIDRTNDVVRISG